MGGLLLLMFEPGAMSHRIVGVHGRGKWQSKQSARQGLRDPTPFGQQLRIRRSRHSHEAPASSGSSSRSAHGVLV